MSYKAENWHIASYEKYFSTNLFQISFLRCHWWNFSAGMQVGLWTRITPWKSVKILNPDSSSQARSRHFIEVSTEFASPSKMVSLTPKSSIVMRLVNLSKLIIRKSITYSLTLSVSKWVIDWCCLMWIFIRDGRWKGYSEPCKTSKMERTAKIGNAF